MRFRKLGLGYVVALVLTASLAMMSTGCGGKNMTADQQVAQQQAMQTFSQFASDNNMDLTLLVSHNGKVGFYQDAAVGIDSGGQLQAVFTAKGGGNPTAKTVNPFVPPPGN